MHLQTKWSWYIVCGKTRNNKICLYIMTNAESILSWRWWCVRARSGSGGSQNGAPRGEFTVANQALHVPPLLFVQHPQIHRGYLMTILLSAPTNTTLFHNLPRVCESHPNVCASISVLLSDLLRGDTSVHKESMEHPILGADSYWFPSRGPAQIEYSGELWPVWGNREPWLCKLDTRGHRTEPQPCLRRRQRRFAWILRVWRLPWSRNWGEALVWPVSVRPYGACDLERKKQEQQDVDDLRWPSLRNSRQWQMF